MEFENVIETYGAEASVIALVVIMLIGFVKMIFKKRLAELGASVTKPIYESMSIILAYGLTALWLVISAYQLHMRSTNFVWQDFMSAGSMSYVVVKVIYPLYENYHVRDFVIMIGKTLMSIGSKKNSSASNVASAETSGKLPESVKEITTPTVKVNETLVESKKK